MMNCQLNQYSNAIWLVARKYSREKRLREFKEKVRLREEEEINMKNGQVKKSHVTLGNLEAKELAGMKGAIGVELKDFD